MPDWTARFIAADDSTDGAPLLRTHFRLHTGHGSVETAGLTVSALGVCEAHLNGRAVAEDLLTPGWSSYEWRLRFAQYDVTDLLEAESTLGIALGNGWYRGRLGWGAGAEKYGEEIAAFAELRILFADGHEQLICTDDAWQSHSSAVTANDLYDGQSIDARRRDDAWSSADFDASAWSGTHLVDTDLGILEPYIGPPVRRQRYIDPTSIWTSPSGKTLIDFGENIVGWLRVDVTGLTGDVVSVRHAEVLEHDELGVRPLRTAKATDQYILSGRRDVFEPTFTLHGFRYAEVDGWPEGDLDSLRKGLTAVVVGSELERTGTFSSSNPLLNQLHDNIVRGTAGNFVDVPTDCPQRDERLGWTGDIAVFAPTASYLFDVESFLRDWLRDLALEQKHHDGRVPLVVPDVLKTMKADPALPPVDAIAIWSDAAVWVPWALWQAHGDPTVLEDTIESMTSHLRRVQSLLSSEGLWNTNFQLGDWLDPDAPSDQPWAAKADPGVVATASAYRSATITAASAAVLGRDELSDEFTEFATNLKDAFRHHYVDRSAKRISSDCTTAYTLAIAFDLLEPQDAAWAGDRLAELVETSGHRVTTGFAGTPFITDALTKTGHVDSAYRLLLQQECPSWLYPVTMGATTVWERWDSMLPDGSINPGEMTSFNHYALGSVADWMHRTVVGIVPAGPGYSSVLIAPQPGGDLDWVESSLRTPHGTISVRWSLTENDLTVDVTVPGGIEAVLRVPGRDGEDIPLPTGQTSVTRRYLQK